VSGSTMYRTPGGELDRALRVLWRGSEILQEKGNATSTTNSSLHENLPVVGI
jgi:hypothetical protein